MKIINVYDNKRLFELQTQRKTAFRETISFFAAAAVFVACYVLLAAAF